MDRDHKWVAGVTLPPFIGDGQDGAGEDEP
jgi:hypothetical protein